MIWQWEWLVPTIAIVAAIVFTVRWIERRNTRLAADADRQNELAAQGDERGIFGDYPPVDAA
jgi:cytochrome c-type biogenesis protein CcmH/NrfF